MNSTLLKSSPLWLAGALVLVVGGFVIYSGRSRPGPAGAVRADARVQSGPVRAVLNLSGGEAPVIDLGTMPLGAIRQLNLDLTGLEGGQIAEVQSSCSCLQTEDMTGAEPGGMTGRYFAVRPGKVEVSLAISGIDAAGKSGTVTARIVGEVQPGDAALSARLTELVKHPQLSYGNTEPVLLRSPGDALAAVEAKKGIVIDIRAEAEFAASHLEGSLNIPLSQLRPNGAFRGRDFYLTGPALLTGPLQSACVQLQQGVSVKVFAVTGGVQAWQAAGGKVFQELDPAPVVGSLGIDELAQRAPGQPLHILGAVAGRDFDFHYLFAEGTLAAPGSSPADWIESQLKADPSARLVLLDESGKNYGLLNQNAPPHWLGRVYYLQAPFLEYLETTGRMAQLAAAGPTRSTSAVRGFAPRDGMHRTSLPSAPGCGTCPK
jgi:hypothetical protein